MVKFSKELEAQLIPEWKEAFVNYWQLKKHVKKIKLSRKSKQLNQVPNCDFGVSVLDPIRVLAKKICSRFNSIVREKPDIAQEQVIRRGIVQEDVDEEKEIYENELAQLFSEEDEVKAFFEALDEELKKVDQFYKNKEGEFLERGEMLNKQLQILVDLKQVLSDRRRKTLRSHSSFGFFSHSNSSTPSNSHFSETTTGTTQTDDVVAALEKNGKFFINSATRGKTKKGKPKMSMRIDIPATTPTRTISAVTSMLWEDLVNNPKKEGHREFINKKKIQRAEKMIRGAFVQLYRGLGLIKTYRNIYIHIHIDL